MESTSQQLLTIFARYPDPGHVKTRLARAIGPVAAAALYAAFLADLGRRLTVGPWRTLWAIAPPDPGFAHRFGIVPQACSLQSGADLGERMHAAFAGAATRGFARCALVGSDMPQLSPRAVREAFVRLSTADLVLGPADDGGYYLIAARGVHDVFTGVAWSSPHVLEQTLGRARELGLRTSLLDPGFDVDTLGDLERLRALIADDTWAAALPATAAALREHCPG